MMVKPNVRIGNKTYYCLKKHKNEMYLFDVGVVVVRITNQSVARTVPVDYEKNENNTVCRNDDPSQPGPALGLRNGPWPNYAYIKKKTHHE